jgi:hypothetical protein
MSVASIKAVQQNLKNLGFYTGEVDGAWGKVSQGAFDAALDAGKGNLVTKGIYDIAWSAKVSPAFTTAVGSIASKLQLPADGPDLLMGCMAFETGETFSPTIKNAAGAPYYGLIQFGAAAAKDVGTSLPELLKMSAEGQLEYVYRFFKPYTGKLQTLSDIYMRILWPAAVGKPENYRLWEAGSKAYLQNKGLDIDKDGVILKSEAAAMVAAKLRKGQQLVNRRALI